MEPKIPISVLISEQKFFDEEALALEGESLMIPQDQLDRYRNARLHPLNITPETKEETGTDKDGVLRLAEPWR